MATFEELRDDAAEKYDIEHKDNDGFTILFEYENGRRQLVACLRFEAVGREFIEFRTRVCGKDSLDFEAALQWNAEFPLGALALEEDYFWLVANLPVKDMDPDEFELPLNILASVADDLEKTYSDGADQY